MDPMSFLLQDPLYHLTHDIYGFEPLQFPFDFPVEPKPQQITGNMNNGDVNPPRARDEIGINSQVDPTMDGGDQGYNGDQKKRKKDKEKEKRVMHREVEKQRRQEMASLHRALRSLLPVEYLKGKRSMSDHLHEAVKYIKHLNSKNHELEDKRKKLKAAQTDEEAPRLQYADRVVVRACREGVEVLVGVSREEDDAYGMALSTSTVLKALIRQGLDVTSCLSTRTDDNKWLHCVQAQVGEGTNVYSELQQQLTKKLCAQ